MAQVSTTSTNLGGVELDPGLALDKGGRYLHDHCFYGVGRAPSLGSWLHHHNHHQHPHHGYATTMVTPPPWLHYHHGYTTTKVTPPPPWLHHHHQSTGPPRNPQNPPEGSSAPYRAPPRQARNPRRVLDAPSSRRGGRRGRNPDTGNIMIRRSIGGTRRRTRNEMHQGRKRTRGCYLEHKAHEDVVLALPLLEGGEVGGQRGVRVHTRHLHVPLVEGVVH